MPAARPTGDDSRVGASARSPQSDASWITTAFRPERALKLGPAYARELDLVIGKTRWAGRSSCGTWAAATS